MKPVPREIQPLVYLLGWGAFCFRGNCQHFLLRSCLVLFTDLINCVKLPVTPIRVLQTPGNGISAQRVTEMAAEHIWVHVQVTGMKWPWYVIPGFTGLASQWCLQGQLFLAQCLQHETVGFGVDFCLFFFFLFHQTWRVNFFVLQEGCVILLATSWPQRRVIKVSLVLRCWSFWLQLSRQSEMARNTHWAVGKTPK